MSDTQPPRIEQWMPFFSCFLKLLVFILLHLIFPLNHTKFEFVFYLLPARDDRVEEFIKFRAMIMIFQVTQLMGNNIVNAFFSNECGLFL